MNFAKGINKLFTINIVNILILLCLILIMLLIYLNTNTIELFNSDYLTSFINKYIQQIINHTGNKATLATQAERIQKLSDSVIEKINSST